MTHLDYFSYGFVLGVLAMALFEVIMDMVK